MRLLAAAVVAATLAGPGALVGARLQGPQTQPSGEKGGCQRCKFEATLPCPKHPKNAAKQEEGAIFCSVAAACPLCEGIFRVDCPDCHGAGQTELEAKRAEVERLIEKEKAFEKEMGGYPRSRAITKHLELTFDVESLTVDRKQLGQHELLHLYADRIEKLLSSFNEILGTRESDHKSPRYLVMIWRNPLDQREAAGRYAEGGNGAGVKLLGARGVFTLLRDKNQQPQDDDLHRSVVHNMTHLFLADLFDATWLGNMKAAWVDEGLAHWFEDRGFGQCTNFCYQEQNTLVGFKGGKWRQPVRSMAESGKMPSFAETSQKMSNQLTPQEHALAFSYVDFLLARDAKAFPKLVSALQKKKPTREAIEVYGLTMMTFETEWKKWVLESYAKR